MLPSALALALLALVADAGRPERQTPASASGTLAEPADVLWRYDTGG